ncbi:hypothetical protein VE02_09116 [Pseudogymnoascus sp. 03VT05]|nr:hypothetical protein VE02_09116 [Pseudogymnoascus sp. 03VT05]
MPGLRGPIVLHIMIRSAQDERVAGRQVFEYLRKSGVGAVQHLGGERNDINAMGNLETIPPYEFRGKRYPAGRIIMGAHNTTTPFIMDYLRAHRLKIPCCLIPTASPSAMLTKSSKMLQNAVKHGHGDVRAFSRQNDTVGNPTDLFMIPGGLHGVPDDSISEVLAWEGILKANTAIAACMQRNIRILKAETGITDAEIIRVPIMFRTGLAFAPDNGIGPERNASTTLGVSLYPNPINGLVLNYGDILAPTPWGPIIDGVDILASAVQRIYRKLGFQPRNITNPSRQQHGSQDKGLAPSSGTSLSSSKPEPSRFKKIAVDGLEGVGKSSLITALLKEAVDTSSGGVPNEVLPSSIMNITELQRGADGYQTMLSFWETSYIHERVGPIIYENADLLLYCFSLDFMGNVENHLQALKWKIEGLCSADFPSEIRMPIIMVGCRSDSRDPDTTAARERARLYAESIHMDSYLECSAFTGEGVPEVLEMIQRAVLSTEKFTPRRLLPKKKAKKKSSLRRVIIEADSSK